MSAARPFEATTENEFLADAIRERIEAEGRITFREFMALCLYHPQHGYYFSRRQAMGRSADYLTSPEVHPLFGALVARQLIEMWEAMGCPSSFDVLEMGPGSGLLARDILVAARRSEPLFFEALRYRLLETSPRQAERQRDTLEGLDLPAGKVEWVDGDLPAAGVRGCILSNELVDSFPVHRVALAGGELREVYVSWRGAAFVEELGEPSTPALNEYFKRLGLLPGEGCRAEVNLEALAWVRQVATALDRGFVLTVDYGHLAPELYAPWRRDGTLLCFYRHSPSHDPYRRIGRQDMTAHVDFTSLIEEGRRQGLEMLGLTTQSRFLAALGIGEALRLDEGDADMEEHFARRRAAQELTDAAGLGRIRVLAQSKGVADCRLAGLAGSEPVAAASPAAP